jgi:beta-glucosidase
MDHAIKQVRRGLGKVRWAVASILLLMVAQAVAQSDVETRVQRILGQMTLEEKIDMLGGVDGFFIRELPRLGLPRLKMADGPLGVRNFGPATTMAGGIALAATWNPELAERVGTEIGRDARAKGVHFLLGPGVNIYRAPTNGRNFEYLGEDPYLASRIAVGYIKGVQSQGVSATVKHYMGNNSEFDRHNSDSVIDERTMREIYFPVFEAAVKEAHVGAVMDSYNLVNGTHATENTFLNNTVLKKEWGFDGIVMSDWSATYDGVAAANSGMDLEMPSGKFMNPKNLLPAVRQGQVSVATIDDKVRRILRKAVQFGWLDHDQIDRSVPRFNQQGRQVALQAAREGMVLLKNDGELLPLGKEKVKSIAVIGPDAYPAVPDGGGSARVQPFAAVSFLEGLSNFLGAGTNTYYHRGVPSLSDLADATSFTTDAANGQPGLKAEYFGDEEMKGATLLTRTEQHVNFTVQSRAGLPEGAHSERWTGYYTPAKAGAYDIFVASTGEDGGYYRLLVDDKPVFDSWKVSKAEVNCSGLSLDASPHKVVLEHRGRSSWLGTRFRLGVFQHEGVVDNEAKKLAAQADAVVLAVGFDPETESEAADRTFALPPGQEQLIQEISAVNKTTIVVITAGGAVDMSSWLDHVPAVLQAWYPGQEGGTALAEIAFGAVNPSGRLPVTFERRPEDNPTHDSYYPEPGSNRVVYKEGVFIGYRGYEHNGAKPLFPFGYGLSYTSFAYSKLSVTRIVTKGGTNEWPGYLVAFDVTNNGKRDGTEVAEVYVGDSHAKVPRPAKELKGFAKVGLRRGETRHVSVTLDQRALSYYDVKAKEWRTDPGDFDILVGRSSAQIELRGKLQIPAGEKVAGN